MMMLVITFFVIKAEGVFSLVHFCVHVLYVAHMVILLLLIYDCQPCPCLAIMMI